jgi:hypothetical protein
MNSTEESIAGWLGLYINTIDNTIAGNIFIETVGWGYLFPTKIVPAIGSTVNVLEPWIIQADTTLHPFSGFIWSDNAGWISLESMNATYSGAYYLPLEKSFTGFAWSDELWYIPLGANLIWLSQWLIGKVKILWNVGSNNIYSDIFGDVWVNFNAGKFTPFLNQVKKNVSLLMRNIGTKLNIISTGIPATVGNAILYQIPSHTKITYSSSFKSTFTTLPTTIETVAIVGSDLYIDEDIIDNSGLKKARAIIVLKDESGSGGNIYIGESVKKIYTSLIAEWSLYSGEGVLPNKYYNDTQAKVINLPANQLYIYGNLISRNTIGWSTTAVVALGACPYNATVTSCDRETAIRYDLNYFRNFDGDPTHRYDPLKSTYDAFSVIIEYDPRIVSDPPLGIRTQ